MTPGVAPRVQHYLAAIQVVVGCAPVSTEFAFVIGGVLPSLQVGWGRQTVDARIQHELQCARFELKHRRLPDKVFFLLACQRQKRSLNLQGFHVIPQVLLDCRVSHTLHFFPDVHIKLVSRLPLCGEFVVHCVLLQNILKHIFCLSCGLFVCVSRLSGKGGVKDVVDDIVTLEPSSCVACDMCFCVNS